MFGHGKGFYGWPMCGEMDLAEWLPAFGDGEPLGATSGFHNMITGAYPPCCSEAADGIVYDTNCTPSTCSYYEAASPSQPDLNFAWPTASSFRSWGQQFDLAAGRPAQSHTKADEQTYNSVLHSYARCTVDKFDLFSKAGADPLLTPSITAQWTDEQFQDAGYAHVFTAHADFGSNADMLYQEAFPTLMGQMGGRPAEFNRKADGSALPTNWHQNMAFVWSIVRQNGTRMASSPTKPAAIATALTEDLPMSFYLSDIHIRGGGNSTKAQLPTVAAPNSTTIPYDAPTQLDDVSACWWIEGGPSNCYGRLQNYFDSNHPSDYGA
jgi:hypothetical protein